MRPSVLARLLGISAESRPDYGILSTVMFGYEESLWGACGDDGQILILEDESFRERFSLQNAPSHLVEWAYETPEGRFPALFLWGCWDQGPWYEA